MKRLATIAALVAVFAIPVITSSQTPYPVGETSVPERTVAVECAEWLYSYDREADTRTDDERAAAGSSPSTHDDLPPFTTRINGVTCTSWRPS